MKVKDIFNFLNAKKIIGDENLDISTLSPINDIIENSIICIDNNKYIETAFNSKANAIIMREDTAESIKDFKNKTIIIYQNPKEAFIKLLYFMFEDKKYNLGTIKQTAIIEENSNIDKEVYIGDYVRIGKNCIIKKGAIIESGTFLGDNVCVGENSMIHSNVSIHDGCVIKDRVIIGSSTVIGNDGFGFFEVNGKQMKIPQRGNVIIENDVEIGANVCIDRATLGSTIIREGVKIDNLVQIAHNCDIGEHSIIVSQVGIAGSSKIGHNCVLAGQVGLADHVVLGDRVILGGQSGVMSKVKIESNSIMLGSPAQNIDREKLKMIAEQKLPELIKLVEEKFETKIKRVK
ncbi:UDP-3-O-(3-hydroxymyristoyl)glucosamine N-acyltransferase [Brachyspira aalborgi]|uniref:UDP-3-O-acylglucosamine N-acyltransferase n=1 Tax=Brachyspira aalborgi TaxID=29522 RepID=A0A5C8CG48_9SPIR|nr:UDP-3-O-(3-hydroxymyristoyl)glucosamine N-acyltransferase [Brachyspira aalborgi]TXJ11906.1 UDP-3-O-(3-hydroxymyristoyl)glucosamine N-acyltransferase [Brachyspira aalborgi]